MAGAHSDSDRTSETPDITFAIKDLPTQSVILYPTRAHIIREIKDVHLKPGTTEVEIYGLSPTVDEPSIQIEGQGNATIVDMTVQLVPNRDSFDDAYLEESDDEESSESEDEEEEEEAVKAIGKEIGQLQAEVKQKKEVQSSANEQLATLDRFAKSVTTEYLKADEVSNLVKTYEEDRARIFYIHTMASRELEDLNEQIAKLKKNKEKAGKATRKQTEKIQRQKARQKQKKAQKRQEKQRLKLSLKNEKLRYWPTKVYKVTLTLEVSSTDTPASSRRGSMDEITLADSQMTTKQGHSVVSMASPDTVVSLLLSYVTKEAGWSPRYDLRISSTQKTATIIYRTEFLNRTSETWKDAKLSFSTSQTSYQGLNDTVPFMHAWRIRLQRDFGMSGDSGLLSTQETNKPRSVRPNVESFNRSAVFAMHDNFIPVMQRQRPLQIQQAMPQQQKQSGFTPSSGGLFGTSTANNASNSTYAKSFGTSLFGSNATNNNNTRQTARAFSSQAPSQEERDHVTSVCERAYEHQPAGDAAAVEGSAEALDFSLENSWEDNGLTATYDVPGTRTLSPSSLTRRHKIASLHARNIHLSHISVPKLRSAAFLRAKIRNPSPTVTLLKGSAGVTLDGSFIGNMTIPRVSPGQTFDLSLGVDPGVIVSYPKPSVKRSAPSFFNKESTQVFERSVWVNNTKSQAVELLVLDQVPVSEDGRLKITILTPRGLLKEGDAVGAGIDAKEANAARSDAAGVGSSGKAEKWGSAVAKLKKGGEIDWIVNLQGGKACLLKLDYEASLPPSDVIVPA